jgi:hypothetical protein
MLKKMSVLVITILAVALAVVGPVLSINSAAGSGAESNVILIGSITCPDKSTIAPVGLAFNATDTGGHYIIFNPNEGEKSGDISRTQGSQSTFKFTGTGEPVCDSNSGLTSISVQGLCGSSVTVMYKAENKERGTFTGNVFCRLN